MKTFFSLSVLFFVLCFIACEDNADDNGNGSTQIEYWDSAYFGANILRMDSVDIKGTPFTSYSPYLYSMSAELPAGASVEVLMINTSGANVHWSYESSTRVGWTVRDYEPRTQRFVAVGPVFCDLGLTFYTTGSADIEIFENGSEEPTRTKTIYWHQ